MPLYSICVLFVTNTSPFFNVLPFGLVLGTKVGFLTPEPKTRPLGYPVIFQFGKLFVRYVADVSRLGYPVIFQFGKLEPFVKFEARQLGYPVIFQFGKLRLSFRFECV